MIPNFVNLAEYRPGAPTGRLGLAPDGHKLLTHVSNFREVKRVKDVVRVFARVQRAMPATLVMTDADLLTSLLTHGGIAATLMLWLWAGIMTEEAGMRQRGLSVPAHASGSK